MKSIHYDGSVILTGDAIADAVAEYAAALGANGRTGLVRVPTFDDAGQVDEVELLLGPASELVIQTATEDELEPEDPAFVAKLREAARTMGPTRPVNLDTGHG